MRIFFKGLNNQIPESLELFLALEILHAYELVSKLTYIHIIWSIIYMVVITRNYNENHKHINVNEFSLD